ncbi:MAG TPA: glycosyltransferase family 4 protein [archaeon]|nr:glycosyltransferase family 4 protein [archaeon]
MKIGYFVWEYYPRLVGGLGTYAVEITQKFAEMGHEVVVFTMNTDDLKTSEKWQNIEIHRPMIVDTSKIFPLFVTEDLRRWGTDLKLFCDIFSYNHLSASKFLNQLIKKEGEHFDVVAVHDWLSSIGGIIIKSEEPVTLPVVYHVHSTEEQRSGGTGSEVVKHLERRMADDADRIITVSYAMRDHLAFLGYPANKIRVEWNGCDPDCYNPENVDEDKVREFRKSHGIEPDEKVIFFIGRLTWVKGIQNLVQAMPSILADFPKTKLVVLGKGEEYNDLMTLTKRLNITDKVLFDSKWVSEDERILHYAMSDVCVFPSLSEPFGIVSLEAMSMKKPVVVGARGISGFTEQVINTGSEKCGVHINGNDPADIAWGVKEVFNNPEEAAKWGENGRKRVLQYFTWKKVAEATLGVYKEIAKV